MRFNFLRRARKTLVTSGKWRVARHAGGCGDAHAAIMRRGGVDQQGSTSRRLAERERVCRAQERAGQDSSDGATCLQQRVQQQEQVQHEQLPVASLAQSIGVSDDLYCYESYGCGQSFDNKDEELNGYGGERSMKRQRVGPQHEQRAETTCRPVSSEAQEAQLRVEQRTNQVIEQARVEYESAVGKRRPLTPC